MRARRLQVLSDVHLEFYGSLSKFPLHRIEVVADDLALLGDIGYPSTKAYSDFLRFCSENWRRVFVIPGNHEYYHGEGIAKTDEKIAEVCSQFPNVMFLQRSVYYLSADTVLAGCTMWTDVPDDMASKMNDYKDIPGITPASIRRLHAQNKAFVKKVLDRHADKQIIFVTHHCPHPKLMSHFDASSDVTEAYYSDLRPYIKSCVRAWCCGHTHRNVDTSAGPTRLLSNCFGYRGEQAAEDVRYNPRAHITY